MADKRSLFDRALGFGSKAPLKAAAAVAADAELFADDFAGLSPDELAAKTALLAGRLSSGVHIDDVMAEALATAREASRRALGLYPYPVQLMGAALLLWGHVAEMRTGEGKTLVAALAAYVSSLHGNGVHVVSVNDYLVARDAHDMGRLLSLLGVSTGLVVSTLDDNAARRVAYACDVTYVTHSELGFDYLRDNMAPSPEHQVQRGLYSVIVDEVDSIFIDEARTPLIISGPTNVPPAAYASFTRIADQLTRVEGEELSRADKKYMFDEEIPTGDYDVSEKEIRVTLTDDGIVHAEGLLGLANLFDPVNAHTLSMLQAALAAKELMLRDRDYVVRPNADGVDEVVLIDEFTGRQLLGHRWQEGIHQAVEAKEDVVIHPENQTYATVSYQHLFKMFEHLSGMTGTAITEIDEFAHIYSLDVIEVPTHRPMIRVDKPDLVFKSRTAKMKAIVADIQSRVDLGQPVLAGTSSVEHSEELSLALAAAGIKHATLNAKEHQRESFLIAQAGRPATVTVATNMAGRGTDIMLGGNPAGLARDALAKELAVSFDGLAADEVLARLDELVVEHPVRAAEIEAEYAKACATDAAVVRAAGGLYVLGTERHEARRVDDQLRGRAGRQGDPGESRFLLSLDDDLVRLYSSATLDWVLSRALPDDEPIALKAVAKAVSRAQEAVEGRHFSSREKVVQYDDVLDAQRRDVYLRRQRLLEQEDVHGLVLEAISESLSRLAAAVVPVGSFPEDWNLAELVDSVVELNLPPLGVPELRANVANELRLSVKDFESFDDASELSAAFVAHAVESYDALVASIGFDVAAVAERFMYVSVLDGLWREHLYDMSYLRDGIGLRAAAQLDPLVAWRIEGFKLFEHLLQEVQEFVAKAAFTMSSEPTESRTDIPKLAPVQGG